jgi:hypothetical protein
MGGGFVCCVVEGTDKCVGRDVGDRVEHTLYDATKADARAEQFVSCPSLCPGVHALPILLVPPGDHHKFGVLQ